MDDQGLGAFLGHRGQGPVDIVRACDLDGEQRQPNPGAAAWSAWK
jgi:hypothetical protein